MFLWTSFPLETVTSRINCCLWARNGKVLPLAHWVTNSTMPSSSLSPSSLGSGTKNISTVGILLLIQLVKHATYSLDISIFTITLWSQKIQYSVDVILSLSLIDKYSQWIPSMFVSTDFGSSENGLILFLHITVPTLETTFSIYILEFSLFLHQRLQIPQRRMRWEYGQENSCSH